MNRQEMAAREYLAGNALGEVAQKYAVSMRDVLEAAAKIPRQKVRAKMPRGCERGPGMSAANFGREAMHAQRATGQAGFAKSEMGGGSRTRPRKGGANVITQTNICMECAKACGKCSWTAVAADGETLLWQPVEGWTAEPVKISVRNENGVYREIETYHITACPEFEKG